MNYDKHYKTYYEARTLGNLNSAQQFQTEIEAIKEARKLLRNNQPVWLTETITIDIWETDDDARTLLQRYGESNILSDDEFSAKAQSFKWTFAKTMPQIPHEYIVRDNIADEDTYIEMFYTIEARGEFKDWNGAQYQYLHPGDGYKYWKMTDDIRESTIINREREQEIDNE